jgi:hypothetical protein
MRKMELFFAMKTSSHCALKPCASIQQGIDGHMEEWRAMTAKDIGFDLGETRRDLPVHLWYGRYDGSVSWRVGEAIAEAIGENAKLHIRDESHLSMIAGRGEEILRNVLEDA